jgi:hypothetical protein
MPEAIQIAMAEVSSEVDKILNGNLKKDNSEPAKVVKKQLPTPEEAMLQAEKSAVKADLAELVKVAKKDVAAQKKEKLVPAKAGNQNKKDVAGKTAIKAALKKRKK